MTNLELYAFIALFVGTLFTSVVLVALWLTEIGDRLRLEAEEAEEAELLE